MSTPMIVTIANSAGFNFEGLLFVTQLPLRHFAGFEHSKSVTQRQLDSKSLRDIDLLKQGNDRRHSQNPLMHPRLSAKLSQSACS